jgi:sulfonate transport system ATP-binding protein
VATDLRQPLMGRARGEEATAIDPESTAQIDGAAPGQLAVRAEHITRNFGVRTVLDGVDLTVAAGEFVALLGRSGTGKSTLLRILAGLDRSFSGSVRVSANRAVVFQDARLVPWQRVLANVTLGVRDRDAEQRGRRALAEVGLGDHVRAWPSTLSGGEAQRVALARALVREPKLILADEPFGALDALTRLKMHALLAELYTRHHPAVVLVTHDVDEAITLADRVAVLDHGQIVFDEPVDLTGTRHRHHPGFIELRGRLLTALGVTDTFER